MQPGSKGSWTVDQPALGYIKWRLSALPCSKPMAGALPLEPFAPQLSGMGLIEGCDVVSG